MPLTAAPSLCQSSFHTTSEWRTICLTGSILDPMDDDSKSRFIEVSKDDVDELIAQQENENTKKKTMYDLTLF